MTTADTESLPDYYGLLGVAEDASDEEIRAAWRQRIVREHPDVVGEEERAAATAIAAGINEAYEVLRRPTLRALYDARRRRTPLLQLSMQPFGIEEALRLFGEMDEGRRRERIQVVAGACAGLAAGTYTLYRIRGRF